MSTPQKRSVLSGVGGYLPEKMVTNEMLSQRVDTSHEWIVERTGIHERRFAADDEMASDLAVPAAREALNQAGLKAEDIDLVVVATSTPDYVFPSTATQVQHKLGMSQGLAFDVAGACSGFMIALQSADAYMRANYSQKALVIGTEVFSRLMDMNDRRTCVLFGDGAGAVVLESTEQTTHDPRGILDIQMSSDGSLKDILKAHGAHSDEPNIVMKGQELFRHAVSKLSWAAKNLIKKHHLKVTDIDWLIPHQANLRIIEAVAKKLSLTMDRVITSLDRHANTSAASIPLALNDAIQMGKVKRNDLLLLESIGAGLVWGAGLIRF